MKEKFIKYERRIIDGKTRQIYKKPKSRQLFIIHKKSMIPLSEYKKQQLKRKNRGGTTTPYEQWVAKFGLQNQTQNIKNFIPKRTLYDNIKSALFFQTMYAKKTNSIPLISDKIKGRLKEIAKKVQDDIDTYSYPEQKEYCSLKENIAYLDQQEFFDVSYLAKKQRYQQLHNIIMGDTNKTKLQIFDFTLNYKRMQISVIDEHAMFKKLLNGQDNIKFKDDTAKLENYNYTEYNKKFIDMLNPYTTKNLQAFITEQCNFIMQLSVRDIYTLRYYTLNGFKFITNYKLNKWDNFTKSVDYRLDDHEVMLFFYQFQDFFRDNHMYKGIDISKIINDCDKFSRFINENFATFDKKIWDSVFSIYDEDMRRIFSAAPVTSDIIYLYRGSQYNYVIQAYNQQTYINRASVGWYEPVTYSSCSILPSVAMTFATGGNGPISLYKFIINKGMRLIFLQPITNYENEFEFLIDMKSRYYIDHPRKETVYNGFTSDANMVCPDKNGMKIEITTLKYYTYDSQEM
jgi:hypothetical protein